MLENHQFASGHLAACGGVVVLEHIDQRIPDQFQIIFGEAGALLESLASLAET